MRNDVEVSGFPSSHAGHVVLLRLKEDDYPGTSVIEDWPSWTLPVLKWAKSQGGNTRRLAILGFCRGGRTVWEYAAHNKGLRAGVAFYGSLVDPPAQKEGGKWPKSPTELAADVKAPVLGLYGEADAGIPMAQVEAMKEALAKAKKKTEWKTYAGAPHGFHADYRPSYRKPAAEDGWKRCLAWFRAHGVA